MGSMSEVLDYPDSPTGPQTAVLPDGPQPQSPQQHGPQPQGPQGYAFRPGPQAVPPTFQPGPPRPSRLNKVAASVCIAAGSLVIVAVLFGGGFYLGRETAPVPSAPAQPAATRGQQQGGQLIIPMPRGQFEQPGPGIVIPNGPTFQLPSIFPQLPTSPDTPSTQTPGQPPR